MLIRRPFLRSIFALRNGNPTLKVPLEKRTPVLYREQRRKVHFSRANPNDESRSDSYDDTRLKMSGIFSACWFGPVVAWTLPRVPWTYASTEIDDQQKYIAIFVPSLLDIPLYVSPKSRLCFRASGLERIEPICALYNIPDYHSNKLYHDRAKKPLENLICTLPYKTIYSRMIRCRIQERVLVASK